MLQSSMALVAGAGIGMDVGEVFTDLLSVGGGIYFPSTTEMDSNS